jgi:hypothetical protein
LTARDYLQKLRDRRRRRGAAMAESAIIAMVMVIIFACMWAAVSYHKAKLQAMDQARAQAWTQALQSCSGNESLVTDLGNEAGNSGAGGVPDTQNDFYNPVDNDAFKDSGYVTVTKTRNVKFPGVIGGQSFDMQAKMHMRCNEPKKNDDGAKYFKIVFLVAIGLYALLSIF